MTFSYKFYSFLGKKLVISGVQAKLYDGTKQAKPNSLIRNMVLSTIPINKEANITAFILISIFLILMVIVPEINIVLILTNSNDINQQLTKDLPYNLFQ